MAGIWPDGRVVLQSDDFKHYVALVIDGDFDVPEDKLVYAATLAAWMNAKLAPAQAQAQAPATSSN